MRARWSVPLGSAIGLALLLLPTVAMFYLFQNPEVDAQVRVPVSHFYVVSIISILAFFITILTAIAASQITDARVTFFSLAFLGISGIFAVHGLSTPGVLMSGVAAGGSAAEDAYGTASQAPSAAAWFTSGGVITLSARLSLLVGALLFFASALGRRNRWVGWVASRRTGVSVGFAGAVVAYGVAAFLSPGTFDAFPVSSPWFTWPTTVLAALMFLYAAYTYHQSFTLSRLPLHLAAAVGLVFLAQAQLSMHFAPIWRLSWWEYHGLMLAGFCAIVAGVGVEYGRGRTLRGMIGSLLSHETLEKVEYGYGEGVRALAAAIEVKDPYTKGHLERVADLAVAIGEEMGLPPERLRVLAIGATLHDIGKLGVADSILRNPGRLSGDDLAEMRRHPLQGDVILRSIPSLKKAVALVRHHHEWWNGAGYPDGRKGEAIPLEARIIAVADMFDALTSSRAYRSAWTRERALEQVRQETGTHLDPACAAALERVSARRPMAADRR